MVPGVFKHASYLHSAEGFLPRDIKFGWKADVTGDTTKTILPSWAHEFLDKHSLSRTAISQALPAGENVKIFCLDN